jgi:hypothetical protein
LIRLAAGHGDPIRLRRTEVKDTGGGSRLCRIARQDLCEPARHAAPAFEVALAPRRRLCHRRRRSALSTVAPVSLETAIDELCEFRPEAFRRETQCVGATLLQKKHPGSVRSDRRRQ